MGYLCFRITAYYLYMSTGTEVLTGGEHLGTCMKDAH